MQVTSSKLHPLQGIVLLFLLLVIPVGIYFFQTQNTGEIRSQAASKVNVTPEYCATNADVAKKLKCKADEVPTYTIVQQQIAKEKTVSTATCVCKPKPLIAVAATPTTATIQTMKLACNSSCANDAACGTGMVCALVGGVGKCRNAECFGVEDCACYKVNTPTPTQAPKQCNTSCATDVDCGDTMVCIQDSDGQKKCRNPQCYSVNDCVCYKVSSPTPTPVPPQCNGTCGSDTDCGTSMICVKSATGNKCRNPQCFASEDCLCYSLMTTPTSTIAPTPTPTEEPILPTATATPVPVGGNIVTRRGEDFIPTATPRRVTRANTSQPVIVSTATPTPTLPSMLLADILQLSPTPLATQLTQEKATPPALTIEPFYNAEKQTNPVFLLIGLTDPDAELTITISPDNVMTTVKADTLGNWQYPVSKKLSNGNKQLTIIARTAKGGVTTKTEVFSVVGGFQLPVAAIAFTVLIAGGVAAYVIYQMKKNNQPPTPQNPYMSMTTPEFQQPASQPLTPVGQSQQSSPYGFEKSQVQRGTSSPQTMQTPS